MRQQALSVYRTAGLAGRNELTASFLEDLLAARSARREPTAPALVPASAEIAPGLPAG